MGGNTEIDLKEIWSKVVDWICQHKIGSIGKLVKEEVMS